jgi:hypothetical protein
MKIKTYLYLVMLTVIFFWIFFLSNFLYFKKIKKVPNILIFSITKSQALRDGNFKEINSFFMEPRLKLGNEFSSKVLEIRHIFPFFIKNTEENLIVTRDFTFWLLLRYFKNRELFSIYSIIAANLLNSTNPFFFSDFKENKRYYLDSSIWAYLLLHLNHKLTLITTQTHLSSLPPYFQFQDNRINRIMMWYSVNSFPINKKSNINRDNYLGNLINDKIDCHYVWNSNQAEELLNYGVKDCLIVNSILFYSSRRSQINKKKVITLFDVTPMSDASTIYNDEFSICIIEDIIKVLSEYNSRRDLKIKLRVKPKRMNSKKHSRRYINYLALLHKQDKIDLLNWHENLYDCINESMAILAPPFSSPVTIGQELDVPSAYYFRDDGLWDVDDQVVTEKILRNPSHLMSWFDEVL